MRARDLIVIARRKAGLSQQQLGERLGKPQSTIGRWETGATDPSFDDVAAAVRACGQQLTTGLATADDSWTPLIFEQLRRSPAERLRHVGGSARLDVLRELAASTVRLVVVGDTAGALHGLPLLLPDGGVHVDVVVHPDDRGAVFADPGIRVLEQPPGTTGFRDLARSAVAMAVGDTSMQVASLVDLLRIALSAHDAHAGTWALALDATLQETARAAVTPRERTPDEARREVAAWLTTRS
jgi:transcriptional regulator with XRE-family HTH domain